jgi:hypothetical protein
VPQTTAPLLGPPLPKCGVVTLDIIIMVFYKIYRPERTNSEKGNVIIFIMIYVPGLNLLPSSEWNSYVVLKWSYYVVLKWSYCAVLKCSYHEVLKWSC